MNSLKKFIRVIVQLGFIVFALTMPTKVLAEQVKTEKSVELSPAQELANRLKNLKTYQAKFEQRVRNENGQQIDLTTGIFSIQRPNLFRWEVKQSFEQIIVADGEKIYTYDPELEQVTIQGQSKALSESPLLLMTSNAEELAEAFSIELLKLNENEQGNLFLLKPKNEGTVFESVHILFKDNK
ncbi:MAG: outer membrane lipoprotein chaperone LolA, partial [Kangiellaceae bacterium]|nr:outer membrane lipoprotein chaperone LolA [Kangiellaceae bacterium]